MTMVTPEVLVQTRLLPPRLQRQWLQRPRLLPLLRRMVEEPLTLVSAGTGYGKSTTVAGFLAHEHWPVAWYSLGDEDIDPVRFLRHVIGALRLVVPGIGEHALRGLAGGWSPMLGERAIDLLCNELQVELGRDTFLVFDDYQHVDQAGTINPLVKRLLAHVPSRLHVVILSRRRPQLPGLAALQARGSLVEIGQSDLAFTSEEVSAFFAARGRPVRDDEADVLVARTEGWAIALQLLQQGLSSGADSVTTLLECASPSLQVLFNYLAEEVFNVQPPEVQHFLLHTAILRTLEPALCDAVLDTSDSASTLQRLHRDGLLVVALGPEHSRYQQLFREFLLQHADRNAMPRATLHGRAASVYREVGQDEEAVYHYLAAGDTAAAAALLEEVAPVWIVSGRAATLKGWLDRLPPCRLDAAPELLYARGEAARLLSQYVEAQEWYRRAEASYAKQGNVVGQSYALRGQAQVYLDTVRPGPAEQFLKRALKLVGRANPAERAAVLHLLAENTLNRGRAGVAARLHAAAEKTCPSTATKVITRARIELRTGQIAAARGRLEAWAGKHPGSNMADQASEAHREPLLLLSLLAAWMGEPETARMYAEDGLRRGRTISAPMVEATSEIRLGHSLQLLGRDQEATACYERAFHLADEFGVARTKAEPLMGLVMLVGMQGNMAAAEAYARDALATVQRTGDEWMAALLWLALGAAATVGRDHAALDALHEAEVRFQVSTDTYGLAAVHLWRALARLRAGSEPEARRDVCALLQLIADHEYDYLITRPTLFTPRDRQMLPPVLLLGLTLPDVAPIARRLLASSFPTVGAVDTRQCSPSYYHPGMTLRIQTLGNFRVWRGVEEVSTWGREKARQLLQLLITERRHWLQREQIMERLWPDLGAGAEGQFKVALNALTTALEPGRSAHASSFYIKRSGTAYRFAPPDTISLDVEQFELLLDQAETAPDAERIALYRRALTLYGGAYLGESVYDEWIWETRDRLLLRYLNSACTLAALLLARHQAAEALRWCEAALERDRCWEEAYRLLMRAYLQLGNRPQALRTYERCVRHLDVELGVTPLSETSELYQAARAGA